jgi:hypothetical protein
MIHTDVCPRGLVPPSGKGEYVDLQHPRLPVFVQEQVGHAYASTTAIYASVGDDFKHKTLRAALARVYTPTNEEDK